MILSLMVVQVNNSDSSISKTVVQRNG